MRRRERFVVGDRARRGGGAARTQWVGEDDDAEGRCGPDSTDGRGSQGRGHPGSRRPIRTHAPCCRSCRSGWRFRSRSPDAKSWNSTDVCAKVDHAHADAALQLASLNGAGARPVSHVFRRDGSAPGSRRGPGARIAGAAARRTDRGARSGWPERVLRGLSNIGKRAGQTIFFTSHQLGDAERLADRFAVLVDGRLAALLTASELGDRLASRGVLRLRLRRTPTDLLDRVARVAPNATLAADLLTVPGAATLRPAVLDCVRASGAEVVSLTAEEGRLDVFYRDLVGSCAPAKQGGQTV